MTKKQRSFYDGDDVIYGEHRFRRSDAEALANAMALIGTSGIRIGDGRRGSDYETPRAMYPMNIESVEYR